MFIFIYTGTETYNIIHFCKTLIVYFTEKEIDKLLRKCFVSGCSDVICCKIITYILKNGLKIMRYT